jgi:hypothetical protein
MGRPYRALTPAARGARSRVRLLLGLVAAAQLSLILLTEEAGTGWTGLFQRLAMLLNPVVPPVVAFLPALRPAPRPVR